MKIQRCKGTRDLSPEQMIAFRHIERVFRDSCLKWGYQEVRTPTLEYLHLFTSAGTLTPSMLGRVYSFLDWDGWSGERVVLRPDGTIPVARFYIDSLENKSLARLFYVTSIFVFEETGKQSRERWQCGVELIGAGLPLADTELIVLSLEILKNLKIGGIELRLSHAGLIKALLAKLKTSAEEQTRIFNQILDGDGAVLARIRTKSPELEETLLSLMNLKGHSSGFLRNLKALSKNVPEVSSHLDNFISVVANLEALGCAYKIDIPSGASFEYYTGVIFQLFNGEEKVGGGGRYDALIPAMGGKDVPASGFALYVDRLMKLLKPEDFARLVSPRILVKVGSRKPEILAEAFDIANRLREVGYVVEFNLDSEKLANLRWVVEIKDRTPRFILTDKTVNRRFEAKTADELWVLLGEKGADKDSLA